MIGANLGSDVQNRVDAYKENPAALQKRYMQSQELVDLLAMQKMKSEKAAYARDMQLKMESKPSTIAQQYEAELTGQTKNDMLKNVSGVLKNKQNQAQSNINKVAASGSGVAGQNASNMLKLAEGGIIGFKEGGKVTDIELRRIGMSREEFEKLPESKQEELISGLNDPFGIGSFFKSQEEKRAIRAKDRDGYYDEEELGADVPKETLDKLSEEEKKFLEDRPFFTSPTIKGAAGAGTKSTVGTGPAIDVGLQEALRKQKIGTAAADQKPVVPVDNFAQDKSGGITAAAPTFDASRFTADGAFNTEVKGGISDLLKSDPQKAVDFAARTPAEQAMIEKLLKERTDMRDNMMNPDKLSNDRLMQTLLGAKGATAGEAFRTSGLAGINAERNQENLRRSEFDAINKLFMDEANKNQTLKKDAFKGSQADKRQGVASGSSVTNAEKSAQMEAEKLFATIENNKVANKLKSDLNNITAKRIEAQENNTLANVDTALLRDLTNVEKSASTQFLREYEAKKQSLLISGKKPEERARLEKQYDEEYKLNLENLRSKIASERDTIKSRLTARTGGIDTSGYTVKKKS